MDDCRVMTGDCLELMQTLESASVDTVVMDPPYFLPAAHYNVRSGTFRSLGDLSILEHFFRAVFGEIRRVLKPDGFAYCFCDGQSYPVFFAVAYPLFKRLRPLVWDKETSLNGYSWRHQHELVMFCESSESPAVKTGDGDVIRCRAVPIGDRSHLAEKPVSLIRKLIAKTTPPFGTVLDPFAGSGTTGLAAALEGKRSILMEREASYAAIIQRRLDEARQVIADSWEEGDGLTSGADAA